MRGVFFGMVIVVVCLYKEIIGVLSYRISINLKDVNSLEFGFIVLVVFDDFMFVVDVGVEIIFFNYFI